MHTKNRVKKQAYIIATIVIVAAIAIIITLVLNSSPFEGSGQEVSTGDPANTVLDFYDPWLKAARSTSTDPYREGLAQTPILSEELRTRLSEAEDSEDEIDPVLCRDSVPSQISARPVYENEEEAQIMVMSRGDSQPEQAIVTLTRLNNGWFISEIECTQGETAPEREFSFEREGHLLKSVEPPLDPQYWHLVFEQNGEQGHTAPLFFDEASMCVEADGSESVCDPDEFEEPVRATVRGEMTESGVEVKRINFEE